MDSSKKFFALLYAKIYPPPPKIISIQESNLIVFFVYELWISMV